MQVTPALANAWLEYLTRQLLAHLALKDLDALIQWAKNSLAGLEREGLVDLTWESYAHLQAALATCERRLEMLQRVATFHGELNPHTCLHSHQRRGTGIFYNSVQALQCLECEGWQSIRSVIQ